MFKTLIFASLVLAQGVQVCAAEEVSKETLIAIGKKALAHKQVDAFSPSFDAPSLLGKSFDVTWPISDSKMQLGMALPPGGWDYDPDKQQLTVSVTRKGWLMAVPSITETSHYNPMAEGFEIAFTKANQGKDVEQNALGAKVVVQHWATTSVGLAPTSSDAVKQSVAFDPPGGLSLSKTISMPPAEARSLAKLLAIEVQGQIVPMANGKAVLCELGGGSPRFESNSEGIVEHYCLINSVITSISVRAGDRILATWDQSYRPLTEMEYVQKRFDNFGTH